MIHPDTELVLIDDVIGLGVVATRPIPRGTITWVLDPLDQIIPAERYATMPPHIQTLLHRYGYLTAAEDWVLCWDHARFVNHSCEPNCLSPGMNIEIAVRDIAPGEQLTDDYSTLHLEAPFACGCGTPGCRRLVRPQNARELAGVWDQLLAAAFAVSALAPQPLKRYAADWSDVDIAIRRGSVPPGPWHRSMDT